MRKTKRINDKWEGYYLEDCICQLCLYYGGKKRGCTLKKCCCEEEKNEALAHGRIRRK